MLIGLDRIVVLNLWSKVTWGLVSALVWWPAHCSSIENITTLTLSTLLVYYPDPSTNCFSYLHVCFSLILPFSVVISASVTLLWVDWSWCHCLHWVGCLHEMWGRSNRLPPIAINAQSPESIFLLSRHLSHVFFPLRVSDIFPYSTILHMIKAFRQLWFISE